MWDLEVFYFRAGFVRSGCSFYTDWGTMKCLRGWSFTFGYCTNLAVRLTIIVIFPTGGHSRMRSSP